MMKSNGILMMTAAGLAVLFSGAIWAQVNKAAWKDYKANAYGFTMKVPPDCKKWREKEAPGGWAGLTTSCGCATLYALGRKGAEPKDAEIVKFGLRESRIPENYWRDVAKGENKKGWKWWKIAKAERGAKVVYAGYGVGSRGGYLLFVNTTKKCLRTYGAHFEYWMDNVVLH